MYSFTPSVLHWYIKNNNMFLPSFWLSTHTHMVVKHYNGASMYFVTFLNLATIFTAQIHWITRPTHSSKKNQACGDALRDTFCAAAERDANIWRHKMHQPSHWPRGLPHRLQKASHWPRATCPTMFSLCHASKKLNAVYWLGSELFPADFFSLGFSSTGNTAESPRPKDIKYLQQL